MKKHLLTIVAVLLGMALNAQISVWDGTAEPWTNGSGTAEDPYLIENAQHLAYLAQQVNAPNTHNPYGYNLFEQTYFALTTDLDLGGSNGLLWTPIGKNDFDHGIVSWFCGYFDGDNHTVYNMHIEIPDKRNTAFGLFGMARNGSIKNIILASNCDVDIEYGILTLETSVFVGGILGEGSAMVLENCVSRASVTVDVEYVYHSLYCGGLFGVANMGSDIINCHNSGIVYGRGKAFYATLAIAGIVSATNECNVYGCTNCGDITGVKSEFGQLQGCFATGGIVGVACGECHVEQCCNTGKLIAEDEFGQYDAPASCGGIVGSTYTFLNTTNVLIKNCYNVAAINALSSVTDDNGNYAGGIFGATFGYWDETAQHNISIENCYAAGTITADSIGGILAQYGDIENYKLPVVSNSYYVNTIESVNKYGESLSADYMKSEEFVNVLNADGTVFMMDVNNENNGYPVFVDRDPLDVEENAVTSEVSIYPNPAKDHVRIMLSDKSYCHSAEIYSVDGRLVKSQVSRCETMDVSSLNSGVYVITLRMADGSQISKRLVIE